MRQFQSIIHCTTMIVSPWYLVAPSIEFGSGRRNYRADNPYPVNNLTNGSIIMRVLRSNVSVRCVCKIDRSNRMTSPSIRQAKSSGTNSLVTSVSQGLRENRELEFPARGRNCD